jgi:hypothetical protein
MLPWTFLFAFDLGDLISLLVPIVAFVLWLIGQMSGQQKGQPARPAGQRPASRPPQPADDEDEEDQDGDVRADSLSGEIEEFLRRAGRLPTRPPATAEIVPPPPVVAASAPRRLTQQPLEATVAYDLAERHEVTSHVRQHLDTSAYDQRAEQLGDHVEVADSQMQQHVRNVFEHRIGSLADTTRQATTSAGSAAEAEQQAATATARDPVAASASAAASGLDIAAVLRDPKSVRQAVVLSEILNRPEHRWA